MKKDVSVLVYIDADDPATLSLAAELEALSNPVIVTSSREAAITLVDDLPITVALIDCRDGASSLDMIRRMRMMSPETQCILLADEIHQELLDAINLGAAGFLRHPVDGAQLVAMLRNAVETYDSQDVLARLEKPATPSLHATTNAVLTLDEQAVIVGWGIRAESLVGWTPAEALGRSLNGLFVSSDNEVVPLVMRRLEDKGLVDRPLEVTVEHKDGRALVMESVFHPVETAGRRGLTVVLRELGPERSAAKTPERGVVWLAESPH